MAVAVAMVVVAARALGRWRRRCRRCGGGCDRGRRSGRDAPARLCCRWSAGARAAARRFHGYCLVGTLLNLARMAIVRRWRGSQSFLDRLLAEQPSASGQLRSQRPKDLKHTSNAAAEQQQDYNSQFSRRHGHLSWGLALQACQEVEVASGLSPTWDTAYVMLTLGFEGPACLPRNRSGNTDSPATYLHPRDPRSAV